MKPNPRKLPLSQKRLDANRANAKKSTGPRTPDGKARASRNALAHGLLSRVTVIRHGPLRENAAAFQRVLEDLHRELEPRPGPVPQIAKTRLLPAPSKSPKRRENPGIIHG